MFIPVALARTLEYESTLLNATVRLLLEECGCAPKPGTRVLVKPNLVTRANAGLSCTHPLVVRSVCEQLLERGALITVADSPAFGSAAQVARACGLANALRPLGLRVESLGRPEPMRLSFGGEIGLSRTARDAELIVSIPRLKAHAQMRVTCAVKNLFGCVTGWRKAVAHAVHGDQGNHFPALILDVAAALPPVITLLDAIRPMHCTGPVKGEPFELGLLATCEDPVALDTAIYGLLGLKTADVPLWVEAAQRGLPGATPERLSYPLETPDSFNATGFLLPDKLDPQTFHPVRLARGRLRSLLHRLGLGR
ncbi:MAG: DUF362 domain-containing protein [Desulfovibrio sp.]